MLEVWGKVVEAIRREVKEGRELEYEEGEVGITSLLSCPLKWELRKKYPEVEASAVEIDDGFVWERQVKGALRKIAEEEGGKFEEEKDLVDEVDGVRIRGHLDCFVEFTDEVWGVELKSPRLILFRRVPDEGELIGGVFLVDEEGIVVNNPLYYKQAQIQKLLLRKLYPDKKVRQFLFYKGLARRGRWEKKLYILVPVKDDISEEEYREIVRKFREEKSPRYPNECTSYCEFYRQGLCEGMEFSYEDGKLDDEVRDLLKEYRELQSQMKNVENLLKKKIRGSVKMGGKEIGWVRRKVIEINLEKAFFLLPPEKASDYLIVKWSRKEDLVRELGEEIVEEVREERVWRI